MFLSPRGPNPQFITRQAVCVLRNIDARSCNHCCSGKEVRITYSECVCVATGIQHEKGMRHIVICVLSGCTISFQLFHKRHSFRKELLNIKCVLICLQLLSETLLILRRTEPDMIKNVRRSSCKVPDIIVRL
jgi:hypothetical protein